MSVAINSLITEQLDALLHGETNLVANLANASALLKQTLDDVNWAGFYLYQPATDDLILGPFQGNVACVHIENNRGVCGTALATQQVQRIADVHQFAGHIACDSASNSEVVVPLTLANGKPLGVMDIDSPSLDRFSAADQAVLEEFARVLLKHVDNQ
ncbi:MAG: GAF domain-containing protein [Levilactobacillus sp.]|jgi:GAF domain-containing protein|uniref:GAF domain-containing protein n=1 Tax=Levilactobacillus sp. TaxID=2767919 RepID=UPI00258E5A61|nr:GAF domain-containing protein [Levilactobacillus sp.]MCH4124308.1 GAF domain-containing protein [Levilactobacillus sp.]MCI1554259.1 GAF domain-containing protein [Levilactobacillus sp.]MCI1598843.1 GAF domain-containing protein [Levilactobacillus sp.]MCI1606903.1 GAF domain-containing protein [Levilactobacillus sp.]